MDYTKSRGMLWLDTAIIEIIKKLPEWSFHAVGVIICAALVAFIVKSIFFQRNYNSAINSVIDKNTELNDMRNTNDAIKNDLSNSKTKTALLESWIKNIIPFTNNLNNIRLLENPIEILNESSEALQKMIDTLAADIKTSPGEQHRCAIWSKNDANLLLIVASLGFPRDYAGRRILELNRSTAGRCFRKKELINCSDVKSDEDWVQLPNARSKYSSLICIPIGTWGVLTIDGMKPLDENYVLIGELYASIIDGFMLEYYKAAESMPFDTQTTDGVTA